MKRVVWIDDVHGHGTEGRAAAIGQIEQPANDQVFETIEFNGKDLVDLRLIDDEKKEDKPAPKPRTVVPEAQAAVSLTFPDSLRGRQSFAANGSARLGHMHERYVRSSMY